MANLFQDFRFALRTIRRSPLFATVAILSLALGIGANTAIFTLMDQLMLRQLPIEHPEQLVMLFQRGSHNGNNMGYRMHSYPLYRDLQQKAVPFSEVICRRLIETSLSVDNRTERVDGEMVSGNYFSMLGVKPAAGRLLSSQETIAFRWDTPWLSSVTTTGPHASTATRTSSAKRSWSTTIR
jgi:hypothetical protein